MSGFYRHLYRYKDREQGRYTGCPDQIVPSVNFFLLPNQKTCRKCKDSFGILSNMATKYVIG